MGANLTGSEAYYTGSLGTGTSYVAGDVLSYDALETYPITLYIYDSIGTTPNVCSDEESFALTINATPVITDYEE